MLKDPAMRLRYLRLAITIPVILWAFNCISEEKPSEITAPTSSDLLGTWEMRVTGYVYPAFNNGTTLDSLKIRRRFVFGYSTFQIQNIIEPLPVQMTTPFSFSTPRLPLVIDNGRLIIHYTGPLYGHVVDSMVKKRISLENGMVVLGYLDTLYFVNGDTL